MKNKLFFILAILLSITGISPAQNFEPGEQAQGYLNNKNTIVNYSTGIFNYQIPLFVFKSGPYKLPVSLNYSGKGVGYNNPPGIIGYNWSLQYGGIVTRTMRGGIEDENLNGMAETLWSTNPSIGNPRLVHTRKKDGESDIFTAVYNGKSIRFLIRKSAFEKYEAIPLEKTGVKITCDYKQHIREWKLIDENGITYIYNVPEWTSNLCKQDAVGMNSIVGKSYISSWYLSRIYIPNTDTIKFSYNPYSTGIVEDSSIQKNLNHFGQYYKLTYNYGKAIIEYPFDFNKYKAEFNHCIDEAKEAIEQQKLIDRLNNPRYLFSKYTNTFYLNPAFNYALEMDRLNERILGVLADFSRIASASGELVSVLDNLSQTCNSEIGAHYLKAAKKCVINCLTEKRNVMQKEAFSSSAYQIASPMLTRISSSMNTILLKYSTSSYEKFYTLDTLIIHDAATNLISKIDLKHQNNLLKQIDWKDCNNETFQKQKFTYYFENLYPVKSDAWGFFTYDPSNKNNFDIRECYAKMLSLQTITISTGAKMVIDYEYNRYTDNEAYDLNIAANYYGGIRIKSLVFNRENQPSDSIIYHYPRAGRSIYSTISSQKDLAYGSFTDRVTSSRMFLEGKVLLPGGNNGLYYPYTEEEFVGKGKNGYYFSAPIAGTSDLLKGISFWKYGLLLGKTVYDKEGDLIQLQKNTYQTDQQFNFSKSFPQTQANEFYADKEMLEAEYAQKPPVLLCRDGTMQIFVKPSDIYNWNILPRTNLQMVNSEYSIYYGGKVVLKEQIAYTFPSGYKPVSPVSLINDALPQASVISQVEYKYDNPEYSTYPSRIINHLSNGDERVLVQRRVNDFTNSTSPAISQLQELNMISPLIKEQVFLKKSNSSDYRLLDEKIHLYQLSGENQFPLPYRNLHYVSKGSSLTNPFPAGKLSSIFTLDTNKYMETDKTIYTKSNDKYVPEKINSYNNTTSQLVFDPVGFNVVLRADCEESAQVNAADFLPKSSAYKTLENRLTTYLHLKECIRSFEEFVTMAKSIPNGHYTPAFYQFYLGEAFQLLIKFTTIVCTDNTNYSWSSQITQIKQACSDFINNPTRTELTPVFPLLDQLNFCQKLPEFLNTFEYNFNTFQLLAFDINLDAIGSHLENRLEVITNSSIKKYKAFHVLKAGSNSSLTPRYELKENNKYTPYSSPSVPLISGKWKVICQDIDITGRPSTTAIRVSTSDDAVLLVIVPANATFEAVSKDNAGRTVCKLDHNGNLEAYEYDSVGRVSRVFDQDGNLLKEYEYNLVQAY